MPKPRSQQISLEDTSHYHCCSRVVRNAFLCGIDDSSGQNYEHRRLWVEERIFELAAAFSIDVCAYAVMSNHLHLVLSVDTQSAKSWSVDEVLNQWHSLFSGTFLTREYVTHGLTDKNQLATVHDTAEIYRQRLMDISWFMRALNEPIARRANKEDRCTGRFWEGRFKSQALLDEASLLACMAYVDLNPIRAKMASTPEQSNFTSIQLRIRSALKGEQPQALAKFIGNESMNRPKGLAFSIEDYLELVDATGRCIREDKRGAISQGAAKILERINIQAENWLTLTTQFGQLFHGAVGSPQLLSNFSSHVGLSRRPGINQSIRWFSNSA